MKNLSREQVEVLENAYKKARKAREQKRLQAMRLLVKGYKRAEVQQIVGISKHTLGVWVTAYHKYGLEGLKEKPHPGNHHKLTLKQKQTIKELVTTKTPQDLGFEGRFWSTDALKQLVKEKCAVTYTANDSYYRLFAFCGFTSHTPDKVNKRQSVRSRKEFEERLKKSGGVSNGSWDYLSCG
jgi:transposase